MESSIRVQGIKELLGRLKRKQKAADRELFKALFEAGLIVQTEARRNIQKSARGGKIYVRGNKAHKASAPGESPATDTGMLAAAITVRVMLRSKAVVIAVSNAVAPYGLFLEYGTHDRKLEPRPFMRPALVEKGNEAVSIIRQAVIRGMGET